MKSIPGFLRTTVARYLRDESASVSIFNLIMLLLFCGFLGLAIDTSAGMKAKARLQHVADTASHAGVLDLTPTPDLARLAALDYGAKNISWVEGVVKETDIELGRWDPSDRTFKTDVDSYNAVRVWSNRINERTNGVSLTLLGTFKAWTGLNAWDVRSHSISAYGDWPDCLDRMDGVISGHYLQIAAQAVVRGPLCAYGHEKLNVSSLSLFDCGVELLTPSTDTFYGPQGADDPSGERIGADQCSNDLFYADESDGGYDPTTEMEFIGAYDTMSVIASSEFDVVRDTLYAFAEGARPWDQDGVDPALNDPNGIIPPWMDSSEVIGVQAFNKLVLNGYDPANGLTPGRLYKVECGTSGGGQKVELSGKILNIGVATDCEIVIKRDKKTPVSAFKPEKQKSGQKAVVCDTDVNECFEDTFEAEIAKDYWDCAVAAAAFDSSGEPEVYQTYYDTTGKHGTGETDWGTYKNEGDTDNFADRCAIEKGAKGLFDNVVLLSEKNYGNTSASSFTIGNLMQFGRLDNCARGGGVKFYSAASMQTPSGTTLQGVQFVVRGDLTVAAKMNGVMGFKAIVGGDFHLAAQSMIGGCPSDSDGTEIVIGALPVAIVD